MYIDRILHLFGIPQVGSLVILIFGICNFASFSSIMHQFSFDGVLCTRNLVFCIVYVYIGI